MKRSTHVTIKSMQDLEKEGYKQRSSGNGYVGWYLGSSKYPTYTIPKYMESLLGLTLEILDLPKNNVSVKTTNGEEWVIPLHLVKSKIIKTKEIKRIFRNKIVTYRGYGFKFPCSMSEMGRDEAIDLAKWILKVTK